MEVPILRRKEKEITDIREIESIIRKSRVCRLALADEGLPYIVPLCFGYKNKILYFHSAREGQKIEMLRRNRQVCFEFDIDARVRSGKTACAWGMAYKSIIGFGTASLVEDPQEKQKALDIIMRQYSEDDFEYSAKPLAEMLVIKVDISRMTGKKSD
jgi:nitroimidazol reductase NimA-like FMN-containing flavoprotein (pyridoxamine 5'-phosphate oxidase superfamily)